MEGGRLAAWSAAVFFAPIVAMAAGAAWAGASGVRQLIGAAAGGIAGVAVVRAALMWSQKREKARQP